jgi:hypothetical protein
MFVKIKYERLDVAAVGLALLLRIWEVFGSNRGSEIGYHD